MKNDEKLELYGLFKQGKFGDNNTDKPGLFSFEAKAKWEAWTKKKGMSQDEAMAAYIAYANGRFEFYDFIDGVVK
jgi:diazepam-binding inhibitor (GABA receptor modulating acyl-CoA-binding protein)